MCVILIGNVTWEEHQAAKRENGDGFSLFTKSQGLIKAPSQKQVEQALGKFGVWHYRIGTSGTKDEGNIHPFPICKGEYLLYHNGVFGEGKGSMSDTRALAVTLYNMSLESAKTVAQSLSGTNRIAIVSARDVNEIYLFGTWVSDKGLILSHRLSYTTYSDRFSFNGQYRSPKPWRGNLLEGDDD